MAGKAIRIKDTDTGKYHVMVGSEYNKAMQSWARNTQRAARYGASKLTKGKRTSSHTYKSGPKKGKTETKLISHIQYRMMKEGDDEVNGVAYKFPRHGIFKEYGVSRGHGKGHLRRSMSDWMSSALKDNEQEVLKIVEEYHSNKIMRTFKGIKK